MSRPTPALAAPSAAEPAALRGARHVPYWLDDPDRPEPAAPLTRDTTADLAVVGGGFAGLWTALRGKERDPGRTVVVLEAVTCAAAASGRNGGFAEPTLTHGAANGASRWPDEVAELERLGRLNLDGLVDTVRRHDIDCHLERTGELYVATRPHEVEALAEQAAQTTRLGGDVRFLDGAATRARVSSPTYLAGLLDPSVVLVEPARLDCAGSASSSASRCTSRPRSRVSSATPTAWWCGPREGGCVPTRRCSRWAPDRCCGGCG